MRGLYLFVLASFGAYRGDIYIRSRCQMCLDITVSDSLFGTLRVHDRYSRFFECDVISCAR